MKHLYQTLNKKISFAKRAAITVAIVSLALTSFSQNTLQANASAGQSIKDNSSYPLSFIASLKNSFKVVLNWEISAQKHTSHFVIQRSSDGNDFNDAAVIFTDNDNVKENYRYADNISSMDSGMLYYRLKIVGLDGKSEYSKIEVIHVEKNAETEVAVNDSNSASDVVTIKYPATSKIKQH